MRSVFVFVLGGLVCLQAFGQSQPLISGEYAEARSNEVYTCACLFSSEQALGGREAFLAWDIQAGEAGGTSLAGLKAVAVVVGTDNLGLPDSGRRSILYLDSKATPGQQQALRDVLSRNYGQVLGEVIAVHAVPVLFEKDDGQTRIRAGDVVNVVIRGAKLPQDAHRGSFRWYEPFISIQTPVLSTTLYSRFWGPDFNHKWWTSEPAVAAYTGNFALPR